MQHLAPHLTVLGSSVFLLAQLPKVESERGRENDSVRQVLGEINSYKLETGLGFSLKLSPWEGPGKAGLGNVLGGGVPGLGSRLQPWQGEALPRTGLLVKSLSLEI